MKKAFKILVFLLILSVLMDRVEAAEEAEFFKNISFGAGVNQGTSNQAEESFSISVKDRVSRWEYGLDICASKDRGGVGDNKFAFLWAAWREDFHRPTWQDYGIYAGAGAGAFILQQDLIDWPAGPFILIGWDFSSQAHLEGKVGYFGENYWGTALFYWNL